MRLTWMFNYQKKKNSCSDLFKNYDQPLNIYISTNNGGGMKLNYRKLISSPQALTYCYFLVSPD